jgi:hypothetical protein
VNALTLVNPPQAQDLWPAWRRARERAHAQITLRQRLFEEIEK